MFAGQIKIYWPTRKKSILLCPKMKCNYVGAEQSSSYSPVTFINDLLINLIALHLVCKTALSNTKLQLKSVYMN